ncbi:unnamed protein product [Parascedosporium putredinis]|uniref:Uncharacterized protein n=1 Tax=Parascedosporium putredinis TaxID=1442378 RepID=A0A9P1HB71_9PEZI|nr:unnamed protein product [Parascedosporium putredinis]CAI8003404.1 unnamed protein product [Parascedosporium putredinis]
MFPSVLLAGLLPALAAHALPNNFNPPAARSPLAPLPRRPRRPPSPRHRRLGLRRHQRHPVTTVTPHETTIDGTPTLADAAPNEHRFSNPRSRESHRQDPEGAFARCFKDEDEEFAPFCDPSSESELYVDRTYYITWNPDFFNDTLVKSNGTASEWRIRLRADRVDANNGSIGANAFETADSYPAAWGVYPWKVSSSVLESKQPTNVSLLLLAHRQGQAETVEHRGPTVFVTYAPAFQTQSPRLPKKGAELYIALPSVAAFILIVVFGTCLWNRKTRKLNLGNVMSRSRHGYGVGKARAKRLAGNVRKSMRRGGDERRVMLDEWELPDRDAGLGLGPEDRYKDAPNAKDYHDVPGRRDSDVLGSLAGTPVTDSFPRGGSNPSDGPGRNVFRDELERQDKDRRDYHKRL